VLFKKNYGYSRAGDITTIDDQVANTLHTYSYDFLHRLTGETNSGGPIASGADAMIYDYEGPGPVHAVKSIYLNGQNYSYSYDNNGNMTVGYDFSDSWNVATRTFVYNAENMPTQISHSTEGTTDIVYGPEGGRAKKTSGGNVTYYIGGHYQIENSTAVKYIFGGNSRIAMIRGADVFYFHQDHLGSSSVITNPTGTVVSTTDYLPYGGTRATTGSAPSNYKYTGQEHDPETGLYNYNARLYDPWTGMFVTADSIVPDFSDPQTLNRYSYCRGNPLVYVDPSGHLFGIDDLIIGAIIGAIFSGIQSDWDPGATLFGAFVGGVSGGLFAEISGTASGALAESVVGTTMADYAANGGMLWIAETGGAIAGGAAAGAAAGGLYAGYYGGDIGQGMLQGAGYGAITAIAFKSLEFGWNYAGGKTDASSPTNLYDSTGSKMTAGTRPCVGCSSENQNWFTQLGMAEEGLDHNYMIFRYNTDSSFGHFINQVSKVHDFMNSWGYDANGSYVAGTLSHNVAFQAYSMTGMIPAGVYTALTVSGRYTQHVWYTPKLNDND